MGAWLFMQWVGGSIIATSKIESESLEVFFFFFFFFQNRLVAAAAAAAAAAGRRPPKSKSFRMLRSI